jgi:hypothetical protein
MTREQFDRGLGTTFERFSIYAWLGEMADRYAVRTVLEGPGDGVAGIPGIHSLPLARRGCAVTLVLEDGPAEVARRTWAAQGLADRLSVVRDTVLPLPLSDGRFDLVWNFNRLPFLEPRALIAEMARLSRRYVALVVPNRRNIGFPARWLYHRRTRTPWPYGNTAVMDPAAVRVLLEEVGLQVVEVCWLDVAPWPDILDPLAWLAAMVPGAGRFLPAERKDGYRWGPEDLPYFDSVAYADLHRRMRRLAWLERHLPPRFQTPFAHHFAVWAEVPTPGLTPDV